MYSVIFSMMLPHREPVESGDEATRYVKVSQCVPLQIDSNPVHSTFQCNNTVTRLDTEIACISERTQAHVWLGRKYSTTLVSDDVILLTHPFFDPMLPHPSLFIVSQTAVYWFVCPEEGQWDLVWTHPTSQRVNAFTATIDGPDNTFSISLLFRDRLVRITNVISYIGSKIVLDSNNTKHQDFIISNTAKTYEILETRFFQDKLYICTTATLSLHELTDDNRTSTCYTPVQDTVIKHCLFINENGLIILLTQTGLIQFIDSCTLTLCDEWSDDKFDNISLLFEEDEYYLICLYTDTHELNVINLLSLETVASLSLPNTSSLLVNSNASDQFCFFSIEANYILNLSYCCLDSVSNEIDLERSMVNFSLMQACMDQGFDCVTEIVDNICDSQFQTACFLLWRHYDSIQLGISANVFNLFLYKIPVVSILEGAILWLKSLLLFISLQTDSKLNYFTQIIEWTEGYVENLEKCFPDKWITLSLELVQFLTSQINAIDAWEANRRLAIMQNQLEDIQIVFNTLNIRLSFSRISEYSLSSFLHELLRHAHSSQQIRSLLTSKIISIINRHGESLDSVLYNYILSLEGKLTQEAYLAQLLESKAIAVIDFISSKELKHKCTLFLLTHAKLPMSEKLLNFAIDIENSTQMSMQYELELARVLSIFKEGFIDIPVLHSTHHIQSVLKSLQTNNQTPEISQQISLLASHGSISDHSLHYLIHSSQMLSQSFEEDFYPVSYNLIPLVIQGLTTADQTFTDSDSLLNCLNKLRNHLRTFHSIKTNSSLHYTYYFDNLFKSVYLFHHLKEFETEISIPSLINSEGNKYNYAHVISSIPGTAMPFTSPLKKLKLNSDPQSIFKNFYQLSKLHRKQIWNDLIASALEVSNINSVILLIKLRIEKEGIEAEDKISILFSQILSKFPQKLSELEEPIHTLTQIEQLIASYISVVVPEELIQCSSLLIKIRLIKDVILQSEFEIKPKLSQQQQKESRRIFRNSPYQEKGYILDKSSATNCVLSLSKSDYVISPTHSASILLTLKNLFLPQTALCYLILTIYSTDSLISSPTLHNIPLTLLTSLLRNSPIDITYILSLLLCLSDEEAKRELLTCSKSKTTSPSWFLSMAWVTIYYQKLVALDSFKSYAISALSIGQYITFIRSVTKQKIDTPCTEWTPQLILSKLTNPLFSPVHSLRVAQIFSLDSDQVLLNWIKSAVQNEWDNCLIQEALCLLESRFESLHSLYQSGDTASFKGIKFLLDNLLQLEQSSNHQPMLYKAVCLVNFLISSQSPFLTKSTHLHTDNDTSLLTTDQLTFNDLLGDNPWSLIKDFLTFQYLNIYLGLTAYLDIMSDHLISNTIKAEVTNSKSQGNFLCFQQVRSYLEKLGTREIQIAASKWLGSNMQLLEDKMGAILFAIESAKQWKKETDVVAEIQKACEAHERLQTYYNMLKVKIWLCELGINEENTSPNLYQEPRELIRVLTTSYRPETIYQCSKLYQIIKDICKLFSLDIDTIISDCVSSLISNQKQLKSLNNSFSFCIEGDIEETDVSMNLISNLYTQLIVLLSAHSSNISIHVNNLINIAIRDSKSHSYSNRKAAIQLAIILISHHSKREITFSTFVLDILTQITKQFDSVPETEDNLLSLHVLLELLCVVEELELLGYPMGIGTFLQSSKLSVIQGLVRNFAESFQAFELSARIGMLLTSKVPDAIWQEILEKLCEYKRYSFLLSILPKLTKYISSDFITPLTFNVLTQVPLSQHTNLFPHFIQLAHNLPDLLPIRKEEFIGSIVNFVNEMKSIGEESYAQILEHLVQSQRN